MARRRPGGQHLPINRMMHRMNRPLNFEPTKMQCVNILDVTDSEGREPGDEGYVETKEQCSHTKYDYKPLYELAYVPGIVSGKKQGQFVKAIIEEYFICMKCGKIYPPKEWQTLAKKQHEEKGADKKGGNNTPSTLIVPDDFSKPEVKDEPEEKPDEAKE